jgi:hypothetical protein
MCSWCDFRRHCPAGGSAPAREPWSGLDRLLAAEGRPEGAAAGSG